MKIEVRIKNHPCVGKALTGCAILVLLTVFLGLIGLGTGLLISPFYRAPINAASPGVEPTATYIENLRALRNQPRTRTHAYLGRQSPPYGVFVGVGLSGGGSRAGNFSVATLLELERLGLMEFVSAISSVSGGSLAAAYYGLYQRDGQRWNEATVRSIFRRDFESALGWQSIRYIGPYVFSDITRSHIMATVFDNALFNRSTFAHFGSPDQFPKILINATDLMTRSTFTFTDREFSELGSRLDTFPISLAVAASAAYPGAFHNVTLNNYAPPDHGYQGRFSDAILLDGGVIDNFGLQTLVRMAEGTYAADRSGVRTDAPRGCLLLMVDARPSAFAKDPEISGGKDTFINLFFSTNVLAVGDVLFEFAQEPLRNRLGLEGPGSPIGRLELFDEDPKRRKACGLRCECLVWRIALDGVDRFVRGQDDANYLANLNNLVNAVPTRFFLKGPENCSPRKTQEALFEAARVLVREDAYAIRKVCEWIARQGLAKPAGCSPPANEAKRVRPTLCRHPKTLLDPES